MKSLTPASVLHALQEDVAGLRRELQQVTSELESFKDPRMLPSSGVEALQQSFSTNRCNDKQW